MNKKLLAVLAACALAGCVSVTTTDDSSDHMMDHSEPMMRADAPDVHSNHDSMTMDDMVHGLEGLEGDAFDKAFLEMMIPHHQGAIDMAELVLEHAAHEELKDMARAIISAQQAEIDMMRQWMTDWGYAD